MSHSNDNILNLPPLTPDSGFGFDLAQLASSDVPKAVDNFNAINDKSLQQKVVIDAIASKTRYGMRRLVETDQFASIMFDETARSIMKINEDARGSSYEAYFSAFNDRMVKTAARHIFGLMEVGAASIAKEVMRTPRPTPPTQTSFLKRILG
jgi:hypothetical protein